MDERVKRHIEWLTQLTERWCWKAIAQGVGNRVWRSDPVYEDFKVTYHFQILKPGECAPGSGVIIGPFSGISVVAQQPE